MEIKLYTDGACKGNPGPGGWACILSTVLKNGQVYETKHSGGYRLTTNNRMELAAVIYGLSYINGTEHIVEIVSDSKYICNAYNNGWIHNWRQNGWKKDKGEPLLNADMWQSLWNLTSMQYCRFRWINGHKGHPYNEECDRLAKCAYKDTANLEVDQGYEIGNQSMSLS